MQMDMWKRQNTIEDSIWLRKQWNTQSNWVPLSVLIPAWFTKQADSILNTHTHTFKRISFVNMKWKKLQILSQADKLFQTSFSMAIYSAIYYHWTASNLFNVCVNQAANFRSPETNMRLLILAKSLTYTEEKKKSSKKTSPFEIWKIWTVEKREKKYTKT